MSNFKADIEEELNGEPVEGIVVGRIYGWYDGSEEEEKGFPSTLRDTLQSWDVVAPLLDYEYDSGYGGQECHSIWLWTPTRVLFVHEYDGSTYVASVPRHPTAGQPEAI